jgi:hypothetical protein
VVRWVCWLRDYRAGISERPQIGQWLLEHFLLWRACSQHLFNVLTLSTD